jgi:hypothetical protein
VALIAVAAVILVMIGGLLSASLLDFEAGKWIAAIVFVGAIGGRVLEAFVG